MSAPRVPVCTRCLRPWSGQLQTCDACRSQRRLAAASKKSASKKPTPSNPILPIPILPNPFPQNPTPQNPTPKKSASKKPTPPIPILPNPMLPILIPRVPTPQDPTPQDPIPRHPAPGTFTPRNPLPIFPSPASTNPDVHSDQRRRLNTSSLGDNYAVEALNRAVRLLEEEFEHREEASLQFPPDISPSHIRASIGKFEDEMSAASKTSVCSSCGQVVPTTDIHQINDSSNTIDCLRGCLDNCGRHGDDWQFCSQCHSALRRGKFPKFSAKNSVNVTMCQDYPSALEDLTAIEECLIAICHPVGRILKLRPGGRPSPVSYNALNGHMIVMPQDPGPLLHILPGPELALNTLITVIWLGKQPPVLTELKPFLQVRKDKVLSALQYLVQNNPVYKNVTINHNMIESWDDDFIPSEIANNVIHATHSDHHEREGYTVGLQAGNLENEFHAAQDAAFNVDDNDPFITGSVYTDVNGERRDPSGPMIDALLGIVTDRSNPTNQTTPPTTTDRPDRRNPTIAYRMQGPTVLVNQWEDPSYFTGAFPTLFPNGTGGHLDNREIPVSLDAYAEWALKHHSRR